MPILVTCKFEEDPIRTEGAIVSTTFFSRRSTAGHSDVNGRMWREFELVQGFMAVLITCKFNYGPIKNVVADTAKNVKTFFAVLTFFIGTADEIF